MNRINQFYKVYIFIIILLFFLIVPIIPVLLNPLSPIDGTTSLSSSSIESPETGICRPNGNIRNEWGVSNYTRIDDEVETPDPGDGISNSHAGNYESKIDIFDMTTIDDPNLYRVVVITIYLYCECRITRFGLARIQCSFRFGSNGEWSTSKSVTSPFLLAWKSFTWNGLSVNKPQLDNLQIKLRAYIDATGWGGWVRVDAMYVEASYYTRPGEKIGVFMWCSEVGTQEKVEDYQDILFFENGYKKFFLYEDPNIDIVFSEIDAYEIGLDTIFFYFYGHGEYDNISDNSYWYYSPGLNITSERLRDLMDTLEAERKGFLIDACYSGGFVDDFQDEPYLAMSSSSKYLPAYFYTEPPNGPQGAFSMVFWNRVNNGYDAVSAFELAREAIWWQDPQIADHSTNYDFFA